MIGKLAGATGLEPATSTVTGWHSNQLSYAPATLIMPLKIHEFFGNTSRESKKSRKMTSLVRKISEMEKYSRNERILKTAESSGNT